MRPDLLRAALAHSDPWSVRRIHPVAKLPFWPQHHVWSAPSEHTIAIFKLNVEEYPKSGNVYDSLAEAYAKNGQRQLAIDNYRRSLELDPKNQNAVNQLKELEQK